MVKNTVYANRNFLPFFLSSGIEHFGAGVENYGEYNQNKIVDGNGVYITRNLDYEGTFNLIKNISFNNGINGLVVHKTTHANVKVNVSKNVIFDNGMTTMDVEGRQSAGGLTVNSGDGVSNLLLHKNKVWSKIPDDVS